MICFVITEKTFFTSLQLLFSVSIKLVFLFCSKVFSVSDPRVSQKKKKTELNSLNASNHDLSVKWQVIHNVKKNGLHFKMKTEITWVTNIQSMQAVFFWDTLYLKKTCKIWNVFDQWCIIINIDHWFQNFLQLPPSCLPGYISSALKNFFFII